MTNAEMIRYIEQITFDQFPQSRPQFRGQGGQGHVWALEGPTQNEMKAVKLHIQRPGEMEAFERSFSALRREFEIMKALGRVDGVVHVDRELLMGEHLGLRYCAFTMELYQQSVKETLRYNADGSKRHPQSKLDIGVRARIALAMAQAVNRILDIGIAHCDLKPGNVLLRAGTRNLDEVALSDFGSARVLTDPASSVNCPSGIYVAPVSCAEQEEEDSPDFTDLYAAPEILRKHLHGTTGSGAGVDRRLTDQYALGLTLYQILCDGPLPPPLLQLLLGIKLSLKRRQENELEKILAIAKAGPLSDVKQLSIPDAQDKHGSMILDVLRRMTAPEPEQRFSRMVSCVNTLQDALFGDGLRDSDPRSTYVKDR